MRALPPKTKRFVIVTDIGNQVVHEINAPTRRDAWDEFLALAFSHQLDLQKQYKSNANVRSQMFDGTKNRVLFIARGHTIETWKLQEAGDGVLVWMRNWLAGAL